MIVTVFKPFRLGPASGLFSIPALARPDWRRPGLTRTRPGRRRAARHGVIISGSLNSHWHGDGHGHGPRNLKRESGGSESDSDSRQPSHWHSGWQRRPE
jgi:hypothetical protein